MENTYYNTGVTFSKLKFDSCCLWREQDQSCLLRADRAFRSLNACFRIRSNCLTRKGLHVVAGWQNPQTPLSRQGASAACLLSQRSQTKVLAARVHCLQKRRWLRQLIIAAYAELSVEAYAQLKERVQQLKSTQSQSKQLQQGLQKVELSVTVTYRVGCRIQVWLEARGLVLRGAARGPCR